MTTLTEFLLSRIAEDEAAASLRVDELNAEGVVHYGNGFSYVPVLEGWRDGGNGTWGRARVLAECEAKRAIIAFHESWPVLAETPPHFEQDGSDLTSTTLRMSRKIAWLTEQEYRTRFGDEPPTSPILRILAAVYSDHPEFQAEWRL